MANTGQPLSMSGVPVKENFVQRYLDPASRLGEILFGLIMVLTATLTAGLTANSGKAGVRQLLHAAIGCNVAWGIIDAVMYVMNCLTVRSGKWRLLRAVQSAPDPEGALNIIRRELDPGFASMSGQAEREALYRSILQQVAHMRPRKIRVTRDDLYGALACFLLVFISCLPAAVPFLIFSQPVRALRVSNLLLIGMLFFVGHKWAQYAHTNRMVAGLAMVAIGLGLVGVAVLLGG
jgi:uncharacterized membrane protein YqjE